MIDDVFSSTDFVNENIIIDIRPFLEMVIDLLSIKMIFLNNLSIILKVSEDCNQYCKTDPFLLFKFLGVLMKLIESNYKNAREI